MWLLLQYRSQLGIHSSRSSTSRLHVKKLSQQLVYITSSKSNSKLQLSYHQQLVPSNSLTTSITTTQPLCVSQNSCQAW